MLLWFVGGSLLIVWQVFRDPAIDHRLIVAGALLPDVIDLPLSRPVAHTLVFSVALLVAVMLGTRGRRHARRRLLAVPIGTFVHLVLDGAWTDTAVFWWPFLGDGLPDAGLPSTARPVGVVVLLELAGLAAVLWAWRRFGISDPARREAFLRRGRLVEAG